MIIYNVELYSFFRRWPSADTARPPPPAWTPSSKQGQRLCYSVAVTTRAGRSVEHDHGDSTSGASQRDVCAMAILESLRHATLVTARVLMFLRGHVECCVGADMDDTMLEWRMWLSIPLCLPISMCVCVYLLRETMTKYHLKNSDDSLLITSLCSICLLQLWMFPGHGRRFMHTTLAWWNWHTALSCYPTARTQKNDLLFFHLFLPFIFLCFDA